MAQQSARRGRKNQGFPPCQEHAVGDVVPVSELPYGPATWSHHRPDRWQHPTTCQPLNKPLATKGASTDGKPKSGGGDDVGRAKAPGLGDKKEPANEANKFASNILSQPTEGEIDNSRDGKTADVRTQSEPQALTGDQRPASEVERRDSRPPLAAREAAPSDNENDRHGKALRTPTAEPTLDRPEDLSLREARDAFPNGIKDDSLGVGEPPTQTHRVADRQRQLLHRP